MEAESRVLSPYPFSFLPPGLFAATLFCFEPQNEFLDFPNQLDTQVLWAEGEQHQGVGCHADREHHDCQRLHWECRWFPSTIVCLKIHHNNMKWLPNRVKCTGHKHAASQIETEETRDYFSTGGDRGCFLQQLAGSQWKTAVLRLSREKPS